MTGSFLYSLFAGVCTIRKEFSKKSCILVQIQSVISSFNPPAVVASGNIYPKTLLRSHNKIMMTVGQLEHDMNDFVAIRFF